MALIDNIQAYYKLEDTTDAVGSYNLTNNGTSPFNAGKLNNAWDGGSANSTKWLSTTNALGMSMATNFTYNFWINATTLPTAGNVQTPLHWGDASTVNQKGNVQLQLYNNGGTQEIYLLRQDSAGNDQVGGAYTLTTGTWYMLTYRWDGSNHTLCINANHTPTLTQASTRTGTNTATGSYGTKFELGADTTNSRYLSGLIDEMGVWGRAITDAEMDTLYNSGTPGTAQQYPFSTTSIKTINGSLALMGCGM